MNNSSKTWLILLLLWSLLISGIHAMLSLLSFFGHKKALEWTLPRKNYRKTLKSLKEISELNRPVVLAMASSAGEYEQLLPLLSRLRTQGWLPVIVFFSISGMKYAKARKEEIIWFPTPIDTYFKVKKFFDCLVPELVIIARHELWPNFLFRAAKNSHLALVDASVSLGLQGDHLGIRKKLLSLFDSIHTVAKEDYIWFKTYCDAKVDIFVSGDTKYDRSLERLGQTSLTRADLVENWHKKYGLHNFLLIGSAWPEDLEFVLDALSKITLPGVRLVVVPHQTSPEMTHKLETIIRLRGLAVCRYSDQTETEGVILVDKMGVLFDLYDVAAWVWVGGALHHQVHNVLEPAVRGLPIAFGPKFQSSHEAKDLIEKQLVLATESSEMLAHWVESTPPGQQPKLLSYMQSKAGASDKILVQTKVDQLKNEKKYGPRKNHHQFNTM